MELTTPAVEKSPPRKLGPSASSITQVFFVVWVKITVSYFVKYVKAANLLLSVIMILYNVCSKRYLLPVILLCSEVVYCLLAVLGVLGQITFCTM